MRIYFLAFVLLLFQMSVLTRILSIEYTIPDLLTIFIILYTLKNPPAQAFKLAVFTGIMQDLLSPTGLLFNTFTKSAIVVVTLMFREKFYYSSVFVRGLLIVAVTLIDIGIKSSIIFFKTGIFEVGYQQMVYLLMNFIIFYAVSVADELR
ncbi:hypothetical protein [Persephonella sp.]|nr:hypothetical protein [Aquificota bacterium]